MPDVEEPPGRDPLVTLLESALDVVRKLETRPFDDPGIVHLAPVDRLVLQYVDRHPGETLTALAAGVSLRLSNASAAVTRLVDRGLVQRSRQDAGGRAAVLSLTDDGQRNRLLVHEEWRRVLTAAEVSTSDLRTASRVLVALDARLGDR